MDPPCEAIVLPPKEAFRIREVIVRPRFAIQYQNFGCGFGIMVQQQPAQLEVKMQFYLGVSVCCRPSEHSVKCNTTRINQEREWSSSL